MSSARLYVVMLMAILSIVAAALSNNLDVFEELHVVRTDDDSGLNLDRVPGTIARIVDSGIVSIPVPSGILAFEGPTDLVFPRPTVVIPGLPSVTATSVVVTKSTATSSASTTEVTRVTISLRSSTMTNTADLTPVTEVTSATLSVPVTGTSTEPCPRPTGLTFIPSPVVFTSTETEPCPNATTTKQPIEIVVTISCSTGLCQSTVLPSVPCSGQCRPTAISIPVPCSGNCPTEPTPGVIKVGVPSTLTTGSRPTATAVIISCSGSGCVVPVSCSGSGCHVTVPAAGASGATNASHPVAPITSVIQYTGGADHQSGFLAHIILVAVFLVVFLNTL
ncbi:hypothetical protein N7448_007021 [Penicillium atrosanguineum]|uniref:Uncharacterized protein n=1 Tax=Penicillium atrosanguineum TaxID=1132637 RepID=A0A9W9GZR6_9EURO|nr:hypothetical protein N7448_007021 [Penicillium atrosanguineum]KAJ5308352.1 hypothetical protein N7476_009008 [Penicillium atrosanguineum]